MKKYLWYLVVLATLVSALLIINTTYALFENNASANKKLDIASWKIKLNDVDISTGFQSDFVIDNIVYEDSENTEDGYIAPGRKGYFDIILDPTGTNVAVRYDITINIDKTKYPENVFFSVDALSGSNTVQTDDNTFTGVINLSDLDNEQIKLRLNVFWDNENDSYNQSDSRYGTKKNNSFEIPISVRVSQYLGEDLE